MRPIPSTPTLLLSIGLCAASLACKGEEESGGEVVTLSTRDGVDLSAEYFEASVGRPGIILLHMKPPDWSRQDWPDDFVAGLNDHDWHVLAVDRRGSGESGGDPKDSYEGEGGRYDVEAAVLQLADAGAGNISILAASNGTTSMVDYTVWASGEGLAEPKATAFLTGGSYTENQTAMEAVATEGIPAVFAFSTAERQWSVDQEALDPGSWSWLEYPEGAHGTKMFSAAPEVATDLDAWFVEQLGG